MSAAYMNLLRAWLLIVVTSSGLSCLGQEPDWGQAERDLTALLWASNTPIPILVRAAATRPVADSQAAMFKVRLFLQAGMVEPAAAAVRQLERVCPKLNREQVRSIYYEACESEAWDVAQAVVFYRTLQNELPASRAPAKALELLEAN